MTELRYDVVAIINAHPQPRRSFGGPVAAAQEIAKLHEQGHKVKCLTNAITKSVESVRLSKLAERVNKILEHNGFRGAPWTP